MLGLLIFVIGFFVGMFLMAFFGSLGHEYSFKNEIRVPSGNYIVFPNMGVAVNCAYVKFVEQTDERILTFYFDQDMRISVMFSNERELQEVLRRMEEKA